MQMTPFDPLIRNGLSQLRCHDRCRAAVKIGVGFVLIIERQAQGMRFGRIDVDRFKLFAAFGEDQAASADSKYHVAATVGDVDAV